MNADDLGVLVRRYFAENGSEFGLNGDVRATYVLNDGGYVNAGFTVSDGARSVHVKVAADDEMRDQMRASSGVADLLTARYHAPAVLGWVAFEGREAMVMEHCDGVTPLERPPLDLVDRVVPVIDRLHEDRALAERVADPRALRDSMLDYHVRICSSDLEQMTAGDSFPPFVSSGTVAWMRDEVEVIRTAAQGPAFDGPATAATHGDLWFGNLIDGGERWWIVDWDELALGDPALDLSLLLFTPIDEGADPARWLGARDEAFRERFGWFMRATLLDSVIDVLADWVDAVKAPAHADAVRARKEAHHRWALARYRELYG